MSLCFESYTIPIIWYHVTLGKKIGKVIYKLITFALILLAYTLSRNPAFYLLFFL